MFDFQSTFLLRNYICMKSGEAGAASVLEERENKAKKPFHILICHLTVASENNWVKHEKKHADEGKL